MLHMAFDELLADRIRAFFGQSGADFEEKKMMGGLCIMVESKMCCGTHIDKNSQQSLLMARVGPDNYEAYLEREHVLPMDFTPLAPKKR